MYRKFKPPFFLARAISPDRGVVKPFFDENPNVASAGLGGVVVGGARSVADRAARSNSAQSERRRRLALASGFRLYKLFWNKSTRRAGACGGGGGEPAHR